jgi:hypothetical protein
MVIEHGDLASGTCPTPRSSRTDTRYEEEVRERYDDEIALFYQDVPPELVSGSARPSRPTRSTADTRPLSVAPRS